MKVWCRTCKHNAICRFAQSAIRIFSDSDLCAASDKFAEATRGTPVSVMPYCLEYEKGEVEAVITCGSEQEEIIVMPDWQKK